MSAKSTTLSRGQIEVGESYFGRVAFEASVDGVQQAKPLFGDVSNAMAVYGEIVPDATKAPLQKVIREKVVPRRFVWNLTARIHRSGARWGLWATRQSELSTNPPGGAFC